MNGNQWFEGTPDGWRVQRLKSVANLIDRKANGILTNLPYLGLEHVESWTGKEVATSEPTRAEGMINEFCNGDVLFGKLRPYLAKAIAPTYDGVCSTEFLVLRPRLVSASFLLYALLSSTFIDAVNASTYGVKMPRASWQIVGSLPFPLPPATLQADIEDFLDQETAHADALIAKYERLIKLLEEKRVALITQAVTKGLDPAVPMKNSGIEWIGGIPNHWCVMPIRRLANRVETGSTPSEEDLTSEGTPWYTPGDFGDRIDLGDPDRFLAQSSYAIRRFAAGAILVVGIGATLGKVGLPPSQSASNQQCNAITPNGCTNSRFLAYSLVAGYSEMRRNASASTLPILNQSQLKALVFPVPPKFEQDAIAEFIDQQVLRLKQMREIANKAIQLARERRSAIITAAITGQLEVDTYRSAFTAQVA